MTTQEFIDTEMPHLEGWCSINKARKIDELIKKHNPDVCVEIGVFAGRSLFAMGFSLRDNHPNGVAYGIDPWDKDAVLEGEMDEKDREWWSKIDQEGFYNYTLDHLKQYELEKNVQILRGSSEDFIEQFKDIPIELLHIDGNHTEVASVRDVSLYVPLVPAGCPIIMDDVNWPTTAKAQELLAKMADLVYTFDNGSGEAWAVYIKKNEESHDNADAAGH